MDEKGKLIILELAIVAVIIVGIVGISFGAFQFFKFLGWPADQMGIVLISGVTLILLGIVVSALQISFEDDSFVIPLILIIVAFASVTFIGSLIASIDCIDINYQEDILMNHKQNICELNFAMDYDQLSLKEKKKIIYTAKRWNKIIKDHREWGNNFFIGIYYPEKVGELELFDINKIQKSLYR